MSEPQSEEQQPKPQPSFEIERKASRQFIQGSVQTFIQWMPVGGSGWAFVSFLLQQDWFMAVAMLPVVCVTVIWAAYTEGVLTRLREVSQQRGREDVDSLMVWLKNLDETIRWQLAGTEDKYLKCQGEACLFYTTEGLPSTFKPLLKNVFIPLELSGDFFRGVDGENLPIPPGFKWDKEIVKLVEEKDGLKIWDFLQRSKEYPQYRNLAIQAWGGYGKTTLLRNITYVYSEKLHGGYNAPKLIPVLLYLRKWQDVIANEKLSLIALIEKHHIPNLPGGERLKLPPNWVNNLLEDGKMLVMFDGFDEVKEEWRKPVSRWMGKAMSSYSRSYFILTSRPAGYRDYVSENRPLSLFVKPFNRKQREDFIKGWYRSRERLITAKVRDSIVRKEAEEKAANLIQQLDERSELNDLAKNPLLLNMMVNLHSYIPYDSGNLSEQIKLPYKRTQLYREIFRLQLGDRPLVKQINMVLPPEKSQKVLQNLAIYMMQKKSATIDSKMLIETLQFCLDSIEDSVTASSFLKQVEQVSELLVKTDRDYEFAHLSFQAYLAAVEIEEHKWESLLLENYQDSWWKETIFLYVESKSNLNKFLGELCDICSIDSVGIAYECMKVYADRMDESLKEEIQRLRYEPLEEYLKNQQWKKADIETNRLMLQTVGREKNDILRIQEIEKFPCEDLRIIDRLWVKYSNGRFGFSVQKRIYQELGGTEKYNRKILEAFGDRIGWRQGGNWLEYNRLVSKHKIFLMSPPGYLPALTFLVLPLTGAIKMQWGPYYFGSRDGLGLISFLAQRLVTCSIN